MDNGRSTNNLISQIYRGTAINVSEHFDSKYKSLTGRLLNTLLLPRAKGPQYRGASLPIHMGMSLSLGQYNCAVYINLFSRTLNTEIVDVSSTRDTGCSIQ